VINNKNNTEETLNKDKEAADNKNKEPKIEEVVPSTEIHANENNEQMEDQEA